MRWLAREAGLQGFFERVKNLISLKQSPEDLVEEYKRELMRAMRLWASRNKDLDIGDETALAAALMLLSVSLAAVSSKWIPRFYRMGRNRKLNITDRINIASELRKNQAYIDGSLIPYVRRGLMEGGMTADIGEVIAERDPAWQSRAGLYAGAAWASRWLGMGETVRETTPYRAPAQRVRRVLDMKADHCVTCPPKAREYASWDDMLAYCRGLPADGSDQCYSNCRCTIEVEEQSGIWRRVI